MQSVILVLLIFAGALVQKSQANALIDAKAEDDLARERRILGALLGGGGDGGGGGLLGGLLGGGGGKGGGGGLLGGLLGGGKGGGLLGGLLGGGGGGLLGGILGGKDGGLLGGLLGGKGGGLLGGLLGGKDGGLLGGLLGKGGLAQLLNAVFCLIEQLGLNVVLELLKGLGADKLLGLNEIACQEGGKSLISLLVSKDGLIPLGIIDELLCLVKTMQLPSVIKLLDDLGLDKVLGLRNITCHDGVPLLEEGSTAAGLLEKLIDVLGIDIVTEAGVETIIKLDQLLTKEGITDLNAFIEKVKCLLQHIRLDAFTDSLEVVGVAGIIRLNDVTCANSTALLNLDAAIEAGANARVVLPVFLRALGLDNVLKLVADVGLGSLLRLGGFVTVNGTVQISALEQIFCISTTVGIEVAVQLLTGIGLTEVLNLYAIICPNGQALPFPPGTNPFFLVELLVACLKGDTNKCLLILDKSLTENGAAVCPFCETIPDDTIEDECSNVCNG